jgi:hypothetical protein
MHRSCWPPVRVAGAKEVLAGALLMGPRVTGYFDGYLESYWLLAGFLDYRCLGRMQLQRLRLSELVNDKSLFWQRVHHGARVHLKDLLNFREQFANPLMVVAET